MIYYRCKCGASESWSSMGVERCFACPQCGSDLATHPEGHSEPLPHEYGPPEWEIDKETGERWQVRRCVMCHRKERIEPAAGDP